MKELIKKAPEPLGKPVLTTTFLDTNLLHDLITGTSVTAVLQFVNMTPGDWYSKRQATETMPLMDLVLWQLKLLLNKILEQGETLLYMVAPIKSKAFKFRDNKSVVTSSTILQPVLNKRDNIISYHRVREAIAA